MAKHRLEDGEPTQFFNVQGEFRNDDLVEDEYKPRRYEEHVGEVTRMKEEQ